MQSGPFDLAILFRKPILLLNMYEWLFAGPPKLCDRGLLKRLYLPGHGPVNTLVDRLSLPFELTDWRNCLSEDIVVFLENTPAEIYSSVYQFLLDYAAGFKRTPSPLLIENRIMLRRRSLQIFSDMLSLYSNSSLPLDNSYVSRLFQRNLTCLGSLYCNSSFL